MGLRFRKSFKIAPGVKINLNKKSTSVTFGGKGVHYTVNSKGKKTATVGIPGTGISYSESSGGSSKKGKSRKNGNYSSSTNPSNNFHDPNRKKWYQKTGWIIFWLIFFFPLGLFLMWRYTNWKKPVKWIITAFFLIVAISDLLPSKGLDAIHLTADIGQTYDINQDITINVKTKPNNNYQLSDDDYKCSGGKLTVHNRTLSFVATKAGTYKIWAEHGNIQSN